MRDYALNRAMAAESIGASLLTLFQNWRAWSEMAKFANYDDQILGDLGIIRDEVRWALRLPLSQNPRLALEECAFTRARRCSLLTHDLLVTHAWMTMCTAVDWVRDFCGLICQTHQHNPNS